MKLYFLIILLFVYINADAQDGTPDQGFGNNGAVFIPSPTGGINLNNVVYAIAVQPDGKIITAGVVNHANDWNLFQIARHLPNGMRDPNFGIDGLVQIDPSEVLNAGGLNIPGGLAITGDGKIVVVGQRYSFFDFAPGGFGTAVIRLNENGSLDNSFGGGDGKVILQLSSSNVLEAGRDVQIQPDGKIVLTGYAYDGTKNVMTIARLLVNGMPDNSFDGDGRLYVNFPGASEGNGIRLEPGGKILATGTSFHSTFNNDIAVVRLNSDGSYDNSFHGDGKLLVDFNNSPDVGMDLDLQQDGRIVIAGSSAGNFAFLRLMNDGSFDNSFDGDGKKTFDAGGFDVANAVQVQADGKLIFGGSMNEGFVSSARIVIVKLNSDGTPDNSFDVDGYGIYKTGEYAFAKDIVLQTDGKILAAGFGYTGLPPSSSVPSWGGLIMRIQNTVQAPYIFACPANITANSLFNSCAALVSGIDALVNPSTQVNYTLTGATTSSGSGSASGLSFNRGITNVTYSISADPAKSCSFTVEVKDVQPPLLSCTPNLTRCYNSSGDYTIPLLTASDPCGIQSVNFTISGATSRSGAGYDASGIFNEGTSIIQWNVMDNSGNTSSCTMNVSVNKFTARIEDVHAVNAGGESNTIYLGYGQQSLNLLAVPISGMPPYQYLWSTGSTSSSIMANPSQPGIYNYSVSITDASGCSITLIKAVKVIDIRCGNKLSNIKVCKPNGKPQVLCISPNAVNAHLKNGGSLGECNIVSYRNTVKNFKLEVSPNPSKNSFKVFTHTDGFDAKIVLRVLDISGREIEKFDLSAGFNVQFGMNYLPGFYFLEARKGNEVVVEKLIKIE